MVKFAGMAKFEECKQLGEEHNELWFSSQIRIIKNSEKLTHN
jgi:hypothetical protein